MAETMCRRCLMREMDGEKGQFERQVQLFRTALPKQEQTGDEEYAARLSVCRRCDALMHAVCRHCGCYVEMRAAVKGKKCPHPKGNMWELKESQR